MWIINCRCGDFYRHGTDTHRIKTEYYEHRKTCPARTGIFYTQNKEEA